MFNLETSLPCLTPKAVYGLSTDVANNVVYTNETTLGHPCSSVIVIDDIITKEQSFIHLGQTANMIDRLAVTQSRSHMAVAERGEKPRISVFCLKTHERLKLLGNPYKEMKSKNFVGLDFTKNGNYLLALLGKPDFEMLQYEWQRGKVINRVLIHPKKAPVTAMSINPYDSDQIAFVGSGLSRVMNYIDHVWKPIGTLKTENVPFTCSCWINERQVGAGTEDGRLIIFEATDIRGIYRALTLFEFSNPPITNAERATRTPVVLNSLNISSEDKDGSHTVRNLTAFKGGMAYSCQPGIVVLFKQIDTYRKENIFDINRSVSRSARVPGKTVTINAIAFSPSGKQFALTTDLNELYVATIFEEQDLEKDPHLKMKVFERGYHNGPITDISLSRWKPFVMTLGTTDKSVRLWNFETKKLVMFLEFPNDIYSSSLHPTGMLCLLAFTDYLKLNVFVVNGVDEIKSVEFSCCPYCCFSTHGHQFSALGKDMKTIYIYNTINCKRTHILKGHVGPITRLKWTQDDQFLWSTGAEGSIYQWDLRSGNRIVDVFTADVGHLDVTLSPDGSTAYVAGSDGKLRVVRNGQVKRLVDVKHKVLFSVDLAYSDCMLFAAGEKASIIAIHYDKGEVLYPTQFIEFTFHRKPISMLRLSFHDRVVISVSADGTLCFWDIRHSEIPELEGLSYMRQMLVPLQELVTRDKALEEALGRIHFLLADCGVKMQQMSQNFISQMESVIEAKDKKIKELEKRLAMIEHECTLETAQMKSDLTRKFEVGEADRQKTEESLSNRLIKQSNRLISLQEQLSNQQNEFKKEREMLVTEARTNVESSELKAKKNLETCSEIINVLIMKKYADNKKQDEIRLAMEEDCEKEISHVRATSERAIKHEENRNHVLKCHNDQMTRNTKSIYLKMETQKHQAEKLTEENNKLKNLVRILSKKVDNLKQELHEQSLTIIELEGKIKISEKEQSNMEKEKQVSGNVAEEMRLLIEPQVSVISNLRQENEELKLEIKSLLKQVKTSQSDTVKFQMLYNGSTHECKNLKISFMDILSQMNNLKADLTMISEYDYKKLIPALKLVIQKHLTNVKSKDIEIGEEVEKVLKPHEFKKMLQKDESGKKQKKQCTAKKCVHRERLLQDNRNLLHELIQIKLYNREMRSRLAGQIQDPDTSISAASIEKSEQAKAYEEIMKKMNIQDFTQACSSRGFDKQVPKLTITFEKDDLDTIGSDEQEEEEHYSSELLSLPSLSDIAEQYIDPNK